ncbi:glycosyltransferase family 39 protein [Actinocorallia populi]|uniref:glycosyltransferase family 39 protein n=1 Tax=Actinocorallia populi TaxID=2079200 RepID=UPI000D0973B2|nr:glycosyltransferase family 39 protein [Actinocorallia populi]
MTTETSFDIRPDRGRPQPPRRQKQQEEPNKYRSNVRAAPYHIPTAPPIAWAPGNSARRAWLSRFVLMGLLLLQGLLSFRLTNSASPGELQTLPDFRTGEFFTGSGLYPAVADVMYGALGLGGVRFLSMIFMVCATGLLYSWSTRLFNERVGLSAAGAFSVAAPTLVLGALATEDALSLLLLAGAVWLVVLSRSGPLWPAIAAGPVALLAVVVKYAALFYLPSVLLLVVLVSLRHTSVAQAMVRAASLGVAFLISAVYYMVATSGLTTPETPELTELFRGWFNWLGLFLAFGIFGMVMYVRRARMGEVPNGASPDPSPVWRLLLCTAFLLPALLSPLLLMATPVSGTLWRPGLAFGALLAAAIVGVGLVRMIGAHFRFPQIGIMAAVALLALGMAQSEYEYKLWPDYENIAKVLDGEVADKGSYLASDPRTFSFHMENYESSQWTAIADKPMNGATGLEAALRKGTYDLVVIETPTRSDEEQAVLDQLAKEGRYRMLTGVPFQLGWDIHTHQIWIKNLAPVTSKPGQ